MAVGPLARLLAQLVVPVVAVLARALPAAYAQALQNAKKAGTTAESIVRKQLSKQEALQILNIESEKEVTVELIQKQFDKYFKANEVTKNGGSFYLQSKVYRAHELLMEYEKEKLQQQQNNENNNNETQQQQEEETDGKKKDDSSKSASSS